MKDVGVNQDVTERHDRRIRCGKRGGNMYKRGEQGDSISSIVCVNDKRSILCSRIILDVALLSFLFLILYFNIFFI